MAVRKSTRKAQDKPATDSVAAVAFIAGGGSSPQETGDSEEMVRPKLWLKRSLQDLVDQARRPPHRVKSVSRNSWIVEAIIEKLDREGIV